MLVLSRKVGEAIVVPQLGVVFTILETRGEKVKLGIAAPGDVEIFREEVWERICRNREAADPAVEAGTPPVAVP